MIRSFKVFILTFNDELNIGGVLSDLKDVEEVLIVDSFSSDSTDSICEKFGRQIVKNNFINQAIQSNWAIDNFYKDGDWLLRLDSDERVSTQLLLELDEIARKDKDCVGYINRQMYWMGGVLKHAGLTPHFIGRLFKKGSARYEEVTEEHLIHEVPINRCATVFYENNKKNNMEFWLQKHLSTARGEVVEYVLRSNEVKGNLLTNKDFVRTRWMKLNFYNKFPLFFRAFFYFLYRYFVKFGFLDGKRGFSYCFFQAFFYRMLVDQLILEQRHAEEWFSRNHDTPIS